MDIDRVMSRRRVLALMGGLTGSVLLAACGGDDDDTGTAPTSTTAPAPPTHTVVPAATATVAAAPTTTGVAGGTDVDVIVGDVVEYELDANGRWDGPFGSVTLMLHKGHYDGGDVWYIRTDASDPAYAEQEGLVYVPLLANALQAAGSYQDLYWFPEGAEGQGAVISTIPGNDDYTSAFLINTVTFAGDPELLSAAADVVAAGEAGRLTIEPTGIIVNFPLVVWPGGGLPVDTELVQPLGMGPLVEEPDLNAATVTFKLHQCFPGSRYIVTDTSAVPMAPMMGVVGSGPTQKLQEAGATAPITIFLNGIEGPGVMGFQPAIFNTSAGNPAWSPFWDHYAAEWVDPTAAVVLRSQAELDAKVASGEITLYNGLPDTHPNGFVVNCPAPILASNTYTGA